MGITVIITGYEEVSMSGSVEAKVVADDEYDYIEGVSDPCAPITDNSTNSDPSLSV